MAELVTADGVPVDIPDAEKRDGIDREFSRAMATDDPGGIQGPPKRPVTETPVKRRPGRPRKTPEDKPRVTDKPPAATDPAAPVDYVEAAAGVVTLGWATLAGIPWTTPYAAVLDLNSEALTGALANGAKHNPRIAAALDKAANGGGGVYALQLAAVGANMAIQTLQLMKDPVLRADATTATRTKFREFLKLQGIEIPEAAKAPEAAQDAPVAA